MTMYPKGVKHLPFTSFNYWLQGKREYVEYYFDFPESYLDPIGHSLPVTRSSDVLTL